jgi:hypothetical protein
MNSTTKFKDLIQIIFNKDKLIRCFLIAIVPASIFYVTALLGLHSRGFAVMEIIRDSAQQNDVSSFIGFLSNIGVWLWVASAAICTFIVFFIPTTNQKSLKELLILTGLLSISLAIDDFFMIHDRYINQNYCYLAYAIIASLILIRSYKSILETEASVFLLAGFLLASSILTDLIQYYIPLSYHHVQIIEEGFKFTGAATWLYFNVRVAQSYIESMVQTKAGTPVN